MKKLFPENKFDKKGLVEFFDKKGFYIVLILCVVIVGATAVFVTTRKIGSLNDDFGTEKIIVEDEVDQAVIDASNKTVAQSSINTTVTTDSNVDKTVEAAKVVADSSKDNKQSASQSASNTTTTAAKASTTPKPSATNVTFSLPVFGEITFDYSQDTPVYSKTLGDYRTHSGVDIASDRGTQVKAVADGVITDIKNDPRFGTTIIIDHQNGIKTVYANLAAGDMVTVNEKVEQSKVIGSVGNTALFESAEAPHLHFEVWKNDKLVDPKTYLPKK